MKLIRSILVSFVVIAMVFIAGTAQADSITPDSYSATLDVGETVTIHKTVTIDTAPPSGALVDVVFLFDTTGSMGGLINSAKANANEILSNAAGLGDVAFGVAHYEDFPVSPYGGASDTPFGLVQDITSDQSSASAAINSLALGYGADGPESNLYALNQAAETVSWREDSTRIVVWFGDAPGHDGDLDTSGYPSDIGLDDAIASLTEERVSVLAVDVSRYSDYGLDTDDRVTYTGYGDLDGQATAITEATGGAIFDGTETSEIVEIIDDAIVSVFQEYSEVTLDLSSVPAGVEASVLPTSYVGEYDRSVERTFEFDLALTGLATGSYDFDVRALVDGGVVAIESDSLTVGDGVAPVPEPASVLLLGSGLLGLLGSRKKFKK